MLFEAALFLTLASTIAAKLPPVYAKGNKFLFKNGTQFFVKGISYQEYALPEGRVANVHHLPDTLADDFACERDVPILKELGVNAIRVYAVDGKANHDACMKLLDDAGIYVFADISKPTSHIEGDTPKWDTQLYADYTAAAGAMANYTNVVGFFIGNAVASSVNTTRALVYVKAAIRDIKVYLKENNLRPVSIGYTTNDHPLIRSTMMQYLNCGDDDTEMTDFWGIHNFNWCGRASIITSGYEDMAVFYNKTTIPVLLTEYGCRIPDGAESRMFGEVKPLYSDIMIKLGKFSGGFAFTYFQDADDYGVVEIVNDRAKKLANFKTLKQELDNIDPKPRRRDPESEMRRFWKCPENSGQWIGDPRLPPTPDEALCKCMVAQAECFSRYYPKNWERNELRAKFCKEDPKMCSGAESDPVLGHHGAYSMCSVRDRITYQIDTYFKNNRFKDVEKNQNDSCYWTNQAFRQAPTAGEECEEPVKRARERNGEVLRQMALDGVFTEDEVLAAYKMNEPDK